MSTSTVTHISTEPGATHPAPTIVVGYDGSRASRAALEIATRQATPDGRVVIVNAYELPSNELGYPEYGRLLAAHHGAGEALLDAATTGTGAGEGPEYETRLLSGPPAQALQTIACVHHADEIIIGIGGGAAGKPLGDVTRELLAITDRPVVLVAPVDERAGT